VCLALFFGASHLNKSSICLKYGHVGSSQGENVRRDTLTLGSEVEESNIKPQTSNGPFSQDLSKDGPSRMEGAGFNHCIEDFLLPSLFMFG
jgi:hypothetical protein